MIFEKIWGYIKKFFSNRKRNIVLIIVLCLLVIDLVLGLISRVIISGLPDQLGASRWEYDGKVAQVSLFFTEDREITPSEIRRLEYTMELELQKAGIMPEEEEDAHSDGKEIVDTIDIGHENTPKEEEASAISDLYNSCYSAQGLSTLSFENKKAENVDTIGVDGDFFFFHPMELVAGSYFMPEDVMKDKIVIDEQLAWELFGSNDIIGQCVTIGGINHYVSGVVKRQEGKLIDAAGLSKCIVYMSYDSLSRYGEILSGKTSSVDLSEDGSKANIGGINCYEVVMPSPVDGIAAQIIRTSSGYDDQYITVVDNSDRFSFFKLWEVSRNFGKRSMWDKPIFYPYWENLARGYEDILALFNLVRTVCIVVICVILAVLVVLAYRNKKWTVRGIVNYLADKKYDFESDRQKKLLEKQNNDK